MSSTHITKFIRAPRSRVYAALISSEDVQRWMVPEGMTSHVHEFDAREGGRFRISLTYEAPDAVGKSSAHTDTYHGRFVHLVGDRVVVQEMEFETDNPQMKGVMTATFRLSDEGDGTSIDAVHEGVPEGVSPADNELGWRMSLGKLAELVERDAMQPGDRS